MPKNTKKRVGRPPKYQTAEELQAKIDEYFAACDAKDEIYTVPDLAYFLGYSSRHAIFDLKKKKKFSHTIKKALLRIEGQRMRRLLKGEVNPAGAIFDLKNNFEYEDAKKVAVDGKMDVAHAVYVIPGFGAGDEHGGNGGNGGEK